MTAGMRAVLSWFGEPRYSTTDLQRAYAQGRAAGPDRQSLAQALPEHRYCTDHIRGHESCLVAADTILRNLEGGK